MGIGAIILSLPEGVLAVMGELRPDKAVVAGVVSRDVKEELKVLQLELGLANLSQTVGFVLARWCADRRREAPVAGVKQLPNREQRSSISFEQHRLKLHGEAEERS